MYLVLKCPYNISYLCCCAIVVIDREEEHDTKHRGWQHGKQVGLKAPNILDGPNTRNAKFLQKQIHHLEQGCTPNSRFNEIKNLRIGLQWQPSLLLLTLGLRVKTSKNVACLLVVHVPKILYFDWAGTYLPFLIHQ